MRIFVALFVGIVVALISRTPVQAGDGAAPRLLPEVRPLMQTCSWAIACNQSGSCCQTTVSTPRGPFICCPVKREADGTFRAPTEDELVDLSKRIAEIDAAYPELGPERDRAYADILGEAGFVIEQADLLEGLAFEGPLVDMENVRAAQGLYSELNMPQQAIDIGMHVDAKLPVFVIGQLPIGIDPFVSSRLEALQAAQAVAEANNATAQNEFLVDRIGALETQVADYSIVGIVAEVIAGLGQ